MTNDSERTYGIDTAAEIAISAYYKRNPEALTASREKLTLSHWDGSMGRKACQLWVRIARM